MLNRLELQALLEDILGSRNVYYQPPPSISMNYPAIVYGLENIDNTFANNKVYGSKTRYTITVIDADPDSEIVWEISQLPTSHFNRRFTSENLNHSVFTLQY